MTKSIQKCSGNSDTNSQAHPPSLGNAEGQRGNLQGGSIPETRNTFVSGSPVTPSELESRGEENIKPTLDDWVEALKQSAQETSEEIQLSCRKYYMQKSTWNKINERNKELEKGMWTKNNLRESLEPQRRCFSFSHLFSCKKSWIFSIFLFHVT